MEAGKIEEKKDMEERVKESLIADHAMCVQEHGSHSPMVAT